ncbi:MAG: YHYH protein [Chloroflexi bacterium]|nr:MAG: YHYH protein [Chloroflexota bacterium]
MTRRVLLRASSRAGVGAAGLALVGCGDDDDDAAAVAAAEDEGAEPGDQAQAEEQSARNDPSTEQAEEPAAQAEGAAENAAEQGEEDAQTAVSPPDLGDLAPSPYVGAYTINDAATSAQVTVTVGEGVRRIQSNGLPDHETGAFPNAANPNSISAQSYDHTLPLTPELAVAPTAYNVPQAFGIAVNGVSLDPFAAEWWQNDRNSGWQLAALANPLGFDDHDAHVQPTGAYHYHGTPLVLADETDRPDLIGFAGDGFPIYGPYGYRDAADLRSGVVELRSSFALKSGQRPDGPGGAYDGTYVEDYEYVAGSGELDECNGRVGVTTEYPDGTYYYVASLQWPFLGRCFAGAIAASFQNSGPGGR